MESSSASSSNSSNGKPDTVLITGGTDGLGRATAILFASEGYRVFAAGRNAGKRAALEQLAEENNWTLETLDLDVTNDASTERVVAEIERSAGCLDVLVNNAGIGLLAAMEEISLDDLRKQFETNVFGVMRMTQRVLPRMRARKSGCIVNMSSIAGLFSNPLMGPYSGSKHALEGISDALRLELRPFGIRVVIIEPGIIPTNINRTGAELSSRYIGNAGTSAYARLYLNFLKTWQKRVASAKSTPEDCARVILGAVRDPKPRARYSVTRDARIIKVMRWLLSDNQMDKMTMRMLGMDRESDATAVSAQIQSVQAAVEELVRPRR